jgi:hypothetical protein
MTSTYITTEAELLKRSVAVILIQVDDPISIDEGVPNK